MYDFWTNSFCYLKCIIYVHGTILTHKKPKRGIHNKDKYVG